MNTSAPYGILYRDKYSRDEQGRRQYFYEDPAPSSIGASRREIVAMVYDWRYVNGWRIGTIQTELNRRGILSAGYKGKGGKWLPPGPWSRQTVRQMLMNGHYIGKHWEGGERIDVECPVFITREVFDGVDEMFKEEKMRSNGRPATKHLLAGFLRCKICGRRYRTVTGSGRPTCYTCGNFDYRLRKQICKANSQVLCHKIEEVVWRAVWAHITNAARLLANAQAYYDSLPPQSGAAKLERELAAVRSQMQRTQRMVRAGAYDEETGTAETLADKQRIAEIEAELRAAGSVMALPPAYTVKAVCDRIAAVEDEPKTFAERRPVLEKLVGFGVIYDKGIVEIEGKVPVPVASKCKPRFGADAERAREHRDQGEHGVEAKLAEAVADVGGIVIHGALQGYTPPEGNGYASRGVPGLPQAICRRPTPDSNLSLGMSLVLRLEILPGGNLILSWQVILPDGCPAQHRSEAVEKVFNFGPEPYRLRPGRVSRIRRNPVRLPRGIVFLPAFPTKGCIE